MIMLRVSWDSFEHDKFKGLIKQTGIGDLIARPTSKTCARMFLDPSQDHLHTPDISRHLQTSPDSSMPPSPEEERKTRRSSAAASWRHWPPSADAWWNPVDFGVQGAYGHIMHMAWHGMALRHCMFCSCFVHVFIS